MRGLVARGVGQYEKNGFPRMAATSITNADGTTQTAFRIIDSGDTLFGGSTELRFPISRSNDLWTAAFMDVGALSEGFSQLYGNSFRFSVGVGVRFLIGSQIPVRLDYGFVVDRRCGTVDETDGRTCISEEDAGAVDFGLLYTF